MRKRTRGTCPSTPAILGETVCTMKDACNLVPTNPHISTVWKWTRRSQSRLETYRIGGRLVTSHEAVKRFLDKQNQGANK